MRSKRIKCFAFVFTGLFMSVFQSVHPQSIGPNSHDGKVLEITKYSFPEFEDAEGVEKLYSKQEYDQALKDEKFEMERILYSSDSLKVVAYLYKPKQTENHKYPTIIFNRGGYIRGDIGYELAPFFHRFAAEGFIVIAPLYRGSDGADGKDEVGGDDVNDLMNVLPLLKSFDFIDENNIFMYGESRGGMMTFQALRNGFPINAAATFGGFTNFEMLINSKPDLYAPLINALWPDFNTRKEEIIRKRSVIHWADKINAPILLMHGQNDQSVDPVQTLNLAELLQNLKKDYGLIIYNGDNHVLSKNNKDRDARVTDWFKTHIK